MPNLCHSVLAFAKSFLQRAKKFLSNSQMSSGKRKQPDTVDSDDSMPSSSSPNVRIEWGKKHVDRTSRLVTFLCNNPVVCSHLWSDSGEVAKLEDREVVKSTGKPKSAYYEEVAKGIFAHDSDPRIQAMVAKGDAKDITKLATAVQNRLST